MKLYQNSSFQSARWQSVRQVEGCQSKAAELRFFFGLNFQEADKLATIISKNISHLSPIF